MNKEEDKLDKLVNKSQWLYRNITGKKGVPLKKMKRIKDDIKIFGAQTIKKSIEEKDYLEKKLSNVKKRKEFIDKMELQFRLQNFDKLEDLDTDVKNEVGMTLKRKYPQFSYLIKIDNPEIVRKFSNRKYSTISSLGQINQKRNSSTDESLNMIKNNNSNNLYSVSSNTIKEGIKSDSQNIEVKEEDDDDDDDDEEKISFQEKYSGFVNPNLEIITSKNNKKNVIKKESKAVTKIIQVSNALRKWTDENLSKKQIEPLEDYLGRSGHNVFEGKKSYRVSLPSIVNIKEEDEEFEEKEEYENNDNSNNSNQNNNQNGYQKNNQKNKKKKNKKDNEFDILLNACRLMVLDSKPPMPIHVTEEHNIPYEFIEKITDNLGIDISKVKQAKSKIRSKKKNNKCKKEKIKNDSTFKRFQYGSWYTSPSKWSLLQEKREQCRSIQMYPSSENWNKYVMFHKYLESPYNFGKNLGNESQSDNE